jgi:hypothetical protein
MNLDVDFLIDFFKKHTTNGKGEIGEQEGDASAAAPTTGGAAAGGSTSPASNVKKWESGRKFGKSYMNDPKYKWSSDRVMGKTYMGDAKYKWETGVTRGHGNPVP